MTEYVGGTYEGKRGEPQVFFSSMGRIAYKVDHVMVTDGCDDYRKEVRKPVQVQDADVVSSELPNGKHAPCIDIDVPIRAIESTTPDHWHLYIEHEMTWREYKRVLRALVAAGVVEKGYYRASKARRGTHVRLPWVTKNK